MLVGGGTKEAGKLWDELIERELLKRDIHYYPINPLDDEAIDQFLEPVENL